MSSSRSALATASFKKPAWAPGDSSQEIPQRKTLYPFQLAELLAALNSSRLLYALQCS